MSGRRAILIVALIIGVFSAGVVAFTFSRSWGQGERLMASGLRQPRGAVWTPDEGIVVAEAGIPSAGGESTTGRLTWVSTFTTRVTARHDLPSHYDPATGRVTGPMAVAAMPGDRLLVLMGPCAAPTCDALLRIDADRQLTTVAKLPGAVEPWGLALAPSGTAYASDAGADALYLVDAETGATRGRVALPSGSSPRGVGVAPDGTAYVALMRAGQVARVAPDGTVSTAAAGLTLPVAVAPEAAGTLLVLELASGGDERSGYAPKSGRLLRIDPAHPEAREVISSGLDLPTALTRAPDGRAYVTLRGAFMRDQGPTGSLLRIRRVGPPDPTE